MTTNVSDIIDLLKEYKKLTYYAKDTTNFISIKDEIWNSNILIKTLFSMLHQKT